MNAILNVFTKGILFIYLFIFATKRIKPSQYDMSIFNKDIYKHYYKEISILFFIYYLP